MGNWRLCNITGTMSGEHALRLYAALDTGSGYRPACEEAFCLAFSSVHPSLCGIGAWPAPHVNRCGNLHERDYSAGDVAEALRALVLIAPSMLLKVHCGGDYESEECVATISVGEGLVVTGAPERETVEAPPDDQVLENFARNMLR